MNAYEAAVEDMAASVQRCTECLAEQYVDERVVQAFYMTHENGIVDALSLTPAEQIALLNERYNDHKFAALIRMHLTDFVVRNLADDADTKQQMDGHDLAEREYDQAVDNYRERAAL